MPSSFVSVNGFQAICGDGSQSVGNHDCCLCVRDSLSFVQLDVDLLNVEAVSYRNWKCTMQLCIDLLLVLFSRIKI